MNDTIKHETTTPHSLKSLAAQLSAMGKPKLARELDQAARDFEALEKQVRELTLKLEMAESENDYIKVVSGETKVAG